MGYLHRKNSILNLAASGKIQEVPVAEVDQPVVDPETWATLSKVDCDSCTVSFRDASLTLPGMAVLELRPVPAGSWSGHRYSEGPHDLDRTLRRVLAVGLDFVLIFDFRGRKPSVSFRKALRKFVADHRSEWRRRLKSSALVLEENILTAFASPAPGLAKAAAQGSPFLICHSKVAAAEFFKATLGIVPGPDSFTPAPFVSVVDVSQAMWSMSRGQTCLASLACASWQEDSEQHQITFHQHPNGDLRVVQTPPRQILLGAAGGWSPGGKRRDDDGPRLQQSQLFSSSDLCSVAALRLECPDTEQPALIGTHFHFKELLVDAEVEPAPRCSERPPVYKHKREPGCFAQFDAIARKVLQTMHAISGGYM